MKFSYFLILLLVVLLVEIHGEEDESELGLDCENCCRPEGDSSEACEIICDKECGILSNRWITSFPSKNPCKKGYCFDSGTQKCRKTTCLNENANQIK